jgi:hypothetical protein
VFGASRSFLWNSLVRVSLLGAFGFLAFFGFHGRRVTIGRETA